jgi:hypothetical protein
MLMGVLVKKVAELLLAIQITLITICNTCLKIPNAFILSPVHICMIRVILKLNSELWGSQEYENYCNMNCDAK